MAKISQYFKDKAKTIKDYPKTLMKAVYGDDGKRLDNIISDITSDIDSTKAKIGTTDISKYGDGTVTGAIKAACDKSDANEAAIADVNSKLGNTDISSIGDGTITGAVNTINSNLNNLNGRFVGGTVNANQTIQITVVSDSWSKNYVLFTGRSGSMGSMYYRDFEGITPIIGNPDIDVYLDAGYLYIRNNGGVTIQYGIIKIQ